jgi:L-2,4-diaminobutyrate decarboxylase
VTVRAFLDGSPASLEAHASTLALAARAVGTEVRRAAAPAPAVTPDALERLLDIDVAPELGAGLESTLELVRQRVVRNSVVVTDPLCAAHLHCPPLLASLAAEAIISATNQSLDSWDQAPAATHVERRLVAWLTDEYGLGPHADGVFTSGGTQSNLMGLLLARDRAAARAGFSVAEDGITETARRFRIVCSSTSHFSVRKSARILGLGDRSVVEVPADEHGRLDPVRVAAILESLEEISLIPIALVATAGTTDLGAIDPLAPLAQLALQYGMWLHVDAAVGGALVLSDSEAPRLAGIESADSITVDFHKLWFQAISCGAFLVRDSASLAPALIHADYLNPADDEGLPNLVDKSLQTTRRFDALKLLVSLHAHGRRFLGEAVEATLDLAAEARRGRAAARAGAAPIAEHRAVPLRAGRVARAGGARRDQRRDPPLAAARRRGGRRPHAPGRPSLPEADADEPGGDARRPAQAACARRGRRRPAGARARARGGVRCPSESGCAATVPLSCWR